MFQGKQWNGLICVSPILLDIIKLENPHVVSANVW
jgi:hypothetical protein